MPFRKELTSVYTSAIRPAAESEGFICERADEIRRPGVVLEQIDARIEQASVIVVDLIGLNPNVMQELGFARRARKEIVMITQRRLRSLPFDIKHYRVLTPYKPSDEGLADLQGRLAQTLAELRRSGFSSQEDVPRQFLQVSLNCFDNKIAPQLTQEGYELIRPRIENANDYRLEGWEYVTLVDPHDHVTKIVRTQDLLPLRRRKQ